MKRSPIRRKPRSASERERVYGTDARQDFLRGLPCLVCSRVPVELAHTANGGMGRKADADTLVPLCWADHRLLHVLGVTSFERAFHDRLCGRTLASWAAQYAEFWATQQETA